MLKDVQAFYSSALNLTFSYEVANMTPVWRSDYPGLSPLSVIDFDWFDARVAVPHIADCDIVVFVHPQSVERSTYRGVMTHCNVGPYEIQLFVGPENERVTVSGKDFGSAFTHYLCHEISHALYEDLGKSDDTHTHFPVGQNPYTSAPANVLPAFWNYPADNAAIIKQLSRQLAGALVALGIIIKTRAVSVVDIVVAPPVPTPTPEDPNIKLYDVAKSALGKDVAKTQDELGCAEAVSGLLNRAYGDIPAGVLSTTTLYQKLAANSSYAVTRTVMPLSAVARAGDVIISPTGYGSNPQDHGHVGIAARGGVMSNDSATGLFKLNYTFGEWDASFRGRGFPVFIFRRKA